ncbi:hypothetical protein CC2G_008090 [Coprinopsis cinerea AmutBmut pab1-1]|nr:hypothetical protein CC2G_008090 [Coprinopsis cinerea AmutBmut pab1-1]
MMPPRRNTFPFDACYTEQYYDEQQQVSRPPDMDTSPSLVTQLQQVHGLTKKKVYGAKPQRKPFFKDERVERPDGRTYHHAATALHTAPPAYLPDGVAQQHASLSSAGGRMPSLSKVHRLSRIQSSPADVQPRRYLGWAGRESRLSSPEPVEPLGSPSSATGYSDVSPTASSYISSDVSSPVSPASVEDYYSAGQSGIAHVPGIVNGGHSDPSWLQSGYSAPYASPSHVMPPIQQGYFAPQPASSIPIYPEVPIQMYSPGYPGVLTPGHEMSLSDGIPVPVEPSKSPSSMPLLSPGINTVSQPSVPATKPNAVISEAITPAAPPPPAAEASTKKSRHKPEDDEYIELDPKYIEATTNLFNELFPNAGRLPETSPSGTKPALNGTINSSSGSSSPKDVRTCPPGSRVSNGSTTPPSIASGPPGPTPTKLATSSTVTSSSMSASATSSSGSTVDKTYSSTASHGFQQPYTTTTSSSVYPVASGVTPGSLVPVAADPQSVMQAIPVTNPYHGGSVYPPARGTSSLTGWAG